MSKEEHIENHSDFKGLKVNKGINTPEQVNADAVSKFLKRKRNILSVDEYVDGILDGNITLLSKSVTLVESSKPEHRKIAQEIIERCLPHCKRSIRIGITGVPGVGKSTFIETLGQHVTSLGHKLAVLAIDPSSERTKGSILGDKTRMESLSVNKDAYIRPSPSAGSLGGVARKTRETIVLCEAAGFDVTFIETVGVGQSETAVHSMTDFFLLLMLAGAGDELQGIKRGIMEMADLIAINKADGDNLRKSKLAQRQYRNALHLFPTKDSNWNPEVLTCSAIKNTGINEIWQEIEKYRTLTTENGYFKHKRNQQSTFWMHETIQEYLKRSFYNNDKISNLVKEYESLVLDDKMSSFIAAGKLFDIYKKEFNR